MFKICANISRIRYGMMHLFARHYKRLSMFETSRSWNNIMQKRVHSVASYLLALLLIACQNTAAPPPDLQPTAASAFVPLDLVLKSDAAPPQGEVTTAAAERMMRAWCSTAQRPSKGLRPCSCSSPPGFSATRCASCRWGRSARCPVRSPQTGRRGRVRRRPPSAPSGVGRGARNGRARCETHGTESTEVEHR